MGSEMCIRDRYVKDLKDLKLIMEKVGKIKGVEKITRVENLKE